MTELKAAIDKARGNSSEDIKASTASGLPVRGNWRNDPTYQRALGR